MWRADGPDAGERLARYWDARAARRADLADLAADLDPGVIDVVIALHARDDARLPDPSFLGRLEQSLLQAIADAPVLAPEPERAFARDRGPVSASPRTTARPSFLAIDRPWAFGHLAAAALLLFTLGLGYLALRLAPASDLGERFPSILDTSAPAAPTGVSARTPLLHLTLTRPFGNTHTWLGVWRSTFAPGADDREIGRIDKHGDQIFYVESGTITARLVAGDEPPEALGTALDATTTLTTPAAGGELRVAAGEAALLPGGTSIELHNDGAAPATLLWVLGNWTTKSDANGVTWNTSGSYMASLPEGPAILTLDRATLAPNAKIAAAPAPAVTTIGLTNPPFGYLLVDRDGSARNISASPRDVYILTLTPLPSATPTP